MAWVIPVTVEATSEHKQKPASASGETLNAETALTSVYQEHTDYFTSRENRERFEAAPAQYASSHDAAAEHGQHQHGC